MPLNGRTAIEGTGLLAVRPVGKTIRSPGGPTLPLEPIKAGILAMVRAAGGGK